MSVFIDRAADLAGLMERAGRMNSPLAALLPPIAAGRLTLALASKRDWCMSMRQLRAVPGPVLVLLGDDDDRPTGPSGWISAPNLIRWAAGIMVHGAAGEADHYREAATGAMLLGRVLLVETSSAHVNPWVAAGGSKVRIAILPRGGVHPVTPPRETMH